MGFPEPEVVSVAERLVNEHRGKFEQNGRILQQVALFSMVYISGFQPVVLGGWVPSKIDGELLNRPLEIFNS